MDDKDATQYRFSGYQLPLIQLDSTGPSYIYLTKNMFPRELLNQPWYFAKPAYQSTSSGVEVVSSPRAKIKSIKGRLYKPL